MNVTILGNNSALPAFGRHPTSQAIELNSEIVLIDCGEGTQVQMQRYGIKWRRVHHILISHMHGDHYFGLPGLLNSMSLQGRKDELHLFGPSELFPIIDAIMSAGGHQLDFPLHYHPLPDTAGVISDGSFFKISCFPVKHRIPCWGFVIEQKSAGRRLLIDQCELHGIPKTFYGQLKQGADYTADDGSVVPNNKVTADPLPPRRYAYSADTLFSETYLPHITGADLLYHESTYLHEDLEKAMARHHSTSVQAAQMAKMANVGQLLLGHFSSKYKDITPFQEEARAVFENTIATSEGMTYSV